GIHHWINGTVGLGHCMLQTTPESLQERQPLANETGDLVLTFDGRVDNRDELRAALESKGARLRDDTDAELVLHAYECWGKDCFPRLLGPFALVMYDKREQHVVLARDALGDRTLFYHYVPYRHLLVASEEQAILAHPAVTRRVKESAIASFLAVDAPILDSSFFQGIEELAPAHVITVSTSAFSNRCYWQLNTSARIHYRSDQDYADHFLSVLMESVRCRLRSLSPPTVMMSGGMDSTSVAALAARELAKDRHQPPLRTLSWVFDTLTKCDERWYIEMMTVRYQTRAIFFPGDNEWPLRDVDTWPVCPNTPLQNAYRWLKERLYRTAQALGHRVVLTGLFSDEAYTGDEQWLADYWREKRLGKACRETALHFYRQGVHDSVRDPGLRCLAALILARVPFFQRLRQRRSAQYPPWLTPYARQHLPPPVEVLGDPRRRHQYLQSMGPTASQNATQEIYYASRCGIELWHPYRDRRLLEFMLAIPAYQLFSHRSKHVLRTAMKGFVPEPIREREHSTSLLPLFVHGILEREGKKVREIVYARDALWPRYVKAEWVKKVLTEDLPCGVDGPASVLPWQCLSLELWMQQGTL
ncbi:MAG: hypothetical protein HOP18_19545, partial [Deltaproteobacteria bacterium]|nr:hypothetical protein [Deltaproteobacteria bacterium]